jgi:hypothetical protein
MPEICPTCGLPKDICVCGEISKEQQRIKVRLETRKFGRAVTIIDGIDSKEKRHGTPSTKNESILRLRRNRQKRPNNSPRRP